MSELKSYKNLECAFSTLSQQEIVVAEDSEGGSIVFEEGDEVYLKSDVDKVIAEKDEKINILQQSLENSETVSAYRKRTIKEYEVKVDRMRTDISEKDRYISNLKDDVAELQKQVRHNKYERCLAMAIFCDYSWNDAEIRINAVKDMFNGTPSDELLFHHKFFRKWRNRWLELAKKFKEAK